MSTKRLEAVAELPSVAIRVGNYHCLRVRSATWTGLRFMLRSWFRRWKRFGPTTRPEGELNRTSIFGWQPKVTERAGSSGCPFLAGRHRPLAAHPFLTAKNMVA
jgi:hypothetical protein